MSKHDKVTIVEVGPRDGFQPIGTFIDTARKIALIRELHAAGLDRIEATAFVSAKAVPQMADAEEILNAVADLRGLEAQVLVPNARYCEAALAAGAKRIAFVVSVSEKHNRNNVRRSPQESVEEFGRLNAALPADVQVRLNLATAFDCPFDGAVDPAAVHALIASLVAIRTDVEIALCDTTGRVTPDRVGALFANTFDRYPQVPAWVFHGHDTYGVGVANALAAFGAGVRIFDSSIAGLGGCPFAPGATGNVATEDLAWTFSQMGVPTGIDLDRLIKAAQQATEIEGAATGGRVRVALTNSQCLDRSLAA